MPDASVPALAALAHEVRLAWCGPQVEVEGILSAKTGGCPEDCHFCSQSSAFDTPVKATPFLDTDEVLAAAEETAALGASEFCIVLAVRGPDERTMQRILELVPLVRERDRPQRRGQRRHPHRGPGAAPRRGRRAPLQPQPRDRPVATSAGSSPPTPGRSGPATCELVRRHGMELCCGVLLGMGETDAQRIELLARAAGGRPGRGAGQLPQPAARHAARRPAAHRAARGASAGSRCAAWRCPSVILRYAGGREVTLRDLQALGMTSGINALIVGNYLTTLGRSPAEDLQMLADLRMPVGALGAAL